MGEDVSGRENEDELTLRDERVTACTENGGHSGCAGRLGKVASEREVEAGKECCHETSRAR